MTDAPEINDQANEPEDKPNDPATSAGETRPQPVGDAHETDRPSTVVDAAVDELVSNWRDQLAGEVSMSATEVQDRLFDLWGALPDGDNRVLVERWLTETLERHLYQSGELATRLEQLETHPAGSRP